MKTPVAFLIFNRPDTTEKVFEVIRQAKPSKLLVIADGPRANYPGEAQKCNATRAIIDRVDWDCEVLKNYSDVNLGCGLRPATGICWVFEQVEEAIILEDDCVPHPTFFPYCEELLEKYRGDERVMHISAANPLGESQKLEHSYYFSRQPMCWGWASWRRAFRHFDYHMKNWPEIRDKNYLLNILESKRMNAYWTRAFEELYNSEKPHLWDYQWVLACWSQCGLSITPKVNLVKNIGLGHEAATNTLSAESPYASLSANPMFFPLKHPPLMIRNQEADILADNTLRHPTFMARVRAKIRKSIINKYFKIKQEERLKHSMSI